MRKIKPIHIEACSCMLDVFVSILIAAEIDYEYLFSQLWNFNFDFELFESERYGTEHRIGDFVHLNQLSDNEILAPAGVQIIPQDTADVTQILLNIKSSCNKGIPVYVGLDAYYIPWNDCYHFVHSPHYFMISDIFEEKETLECMDPFFLREKIVSLSFDEFKAGITQMSLFYIPNKKMNRSREQILFGLEKNLEEAKYISDRLKKFAVAIERFFIKDVEYANTDTLWNAPVIMNVTDIANSRVLFAMYLKLLKEKFQIELGNLDLKFKACGAEWHIMRALLFKISHKDTVATKQKIVSKVYELSKIENELYQELKKAVDRAVMEENDMLLKEEEKVENGLFVREENKSLIWVNLKQYYNNKAFISMSEEENISLFKLEGVDFLNLFFKKDEIIFTNKFGKKYLEHYPLFEINDNISCSEEQVKLPNYRVKGIVVLGCSIYLNSCEKLILQFTDGTEEKLYLNMKSSESCDVTGRNQIALNTSTVKFIQGHLIQEHLSAQLYTEEILVSYTESTVESILLPDNINMHIFAIWLIV